MTRKPTWLDRAALAFCVVLAFVVVALHVHDYRPLSPIDELQHLDYLYKAPGGHIVARGEQVGEDALRDEVCRGIDAHLDVLPPCTTPAPLDPELFQERGYNTASVHPPTYYFLTGAVAKAVKGVLGFDSLLGAGRALGAAWLGLAVWLMWRLMVHRGAAPLTQVSLLSLVIAAPTVIFASSTVSPDATSLLAGAALLAAVLLWEEDVVRWWVPAVAVAVALGLKFTHVGVVGLVLVYLVVRALQQGAWPGGPNVPDLRRYGRVVIGILGAAFGMLAVWSVVQAALAKLPQSDIPMNESLRADGFPLSELLRQVNETLSPLRDPYFAAPLRNRYVIGVNHMLDVAVLVAVASVAVFAVARSRERALGAATAVAMIALGPVTVLSTYVSTNSVTPTPPRYGLPLLPAVLIVALPAMQNPWVRRAVTVFAGGVVLVVCSQLATA